MLFRWVALLGWPSSVFFSRHRHFFSRPRHSQSWYSGPAFSLTLRGAHVNSGGLVQTRGVFTIDNCRFIRGCGFEPWCVRSPRAQARAKAFRGTLDFDYDPRRPFAGRRGEAHHATHARAASYGCFSELLEGCSSGRPCPVR